MLIFGIFYLKGSEKKYLFQSYQAVLSEIKFSYFFLQESSKISVWSADFLWYSIFINVVESHILLEISFRDKCTPKWQTIESTHASRNTLEILGYTLLLKGHWNEIPNR